MTKRAKPYAVTAWAVWGVRWHRYVPVGMPKELPQLYRTRKEARRLAGNTGWWRVVRVRIVPAK